MTVEEKIREAMSAYAEAIEPNAGSLGRIADRTQAGGRRIPWLRYVPAALAMAAVTTVVAIQVIPDRSPVVQLATATPAPAPALDASYTSPNGDWTFDYPKDWALQGWGPYTSPNGGTFDYPKDGALQEGDAAGWGVSNFEPQDPDKFPWEFPDNGEILIGGYIDIGVVGLPAGVEPKTTQDIFDLFCRPGGPPTPKYGSSLDCRMAEINGRTWVRWLGDLENGGKLLNVSAIFNGKAYQAMAFVGAGDRQGDLLDVAGRIFDTFEIR